MKTLYTEIEVDAAPEQVWAVLVDFDRYAEWNPFIVGLSGAAEEGARLRVRMEPPGGRAATFKPRVTKVASSHMLQWLGHLGVPGLLDGRHTFELLPAGAGTRVVQREEFRGVLVPLVARTLDRQTAKGFAVMNAALKKRVEGATGASAD